MFILRWIFSDNIECLFLFIIVNWRLGWLLLFNLVTIIFICILYVLLINIFFFFVNMLRWCFNSLIDSISNPFRNFSMRITLWVTITFKFFELYHCYLLKIFYSLSFEFIEGWVKSAGIRSSIRIGVIRLTPRFEDDLLIWINWIPKFIHTRIYQVTWKVWCCLSLKTTHYWIFRRWLIHDRKTTNGMHIKSSSFPILWPLQWIIRVHLVYIMISLCFVLFMLLIL